MREHRMRDVLPFGISRKDQINLKNKVSLAMPTKKILQ